MQRFVKYYNMQHTVCAEPYTGKGFGAVFLS